MCPGREAATATATARRRPGTSAREIVRLFQCTVCSYPLREPVVLPCGKSLCRPCLPQEQVDMAHPDRPGSIPGIQCPFDDCKKRHALDDFATDFILNNTIYQVREHIDRARNGVLDLEATTHVSPTNNHRDVLGVPSMRRDETSSTDTVGGDLCTTWTLAEQGDLKPESELTRSEAQEPSTGRVKNHELNALQKLQDEMKAEMNCRVCYRLLYEPMTAVCGHTFCRPCLHRSLDSSRYCPMCRRGLAVNLLLNRALYPPNERLTRVIETFWGDDMTERKRMVAAELLGPSGDFDIPLFVCTWSFPTMPTLLYVFEDRYKLMIRRVLEGDGMFGVVMPTSTRVNNVLNFHDVGTLVRIVRMEYVENGHGESIIETEGVSPIRVVDRDITDDGYAVGKTERIDDITSEEEEEVEALEASLQTLGDDDLHGDGSEHNSFSPGTCGDFTGMSSQRLADFVLDFVARSKARNAWWVKPSALTNYRDCPNNPAGIPWWLVNMLPANDGEKYQLLSTPSVRDRLKICCYWIVKFEARPWFRRNCPVQ